MNYLYDGFSSGFDLGQAARQKKKDREAREAERAADTALRLDLDGKQTERERQLQNDRITADATRQFNQQTWQSGENSMGRSFQGNEADKGRTWQTRERQGSEAHGSTEKNLDRMQQQKLNADALASSEKQFGKKMDFDEASRSVTTALKTRDQNYREDPNSPQNQYQLAHAKELQARNDEMNGTSSFKPTGQTNRPPPPQSAIEMLRKNPGLAAAFDQKYGAGAAGQYLQR